MKPPTEPPQKSSSPLLVLGIVVVFAILLGFGIVSRLHANSERSETAEARKIGSITVRSAPAVKMSSAFDFTLPGTAEPLQDTIIYARTNGYLRERLVDLGDQVAAGQLLASIDTPEVNAQLNQSQAALKQAQAAGALANVTLTRQKDLAVRSVVSRQDFDNAQTAATQAEANIAAAQASVANLVAQQGFSKVVAPFAGTIIERNFDLGALISSGSDAALFRIADVGTLRIYVNVPQTYATSLSLGQDVEITRPENGTEVFHGQVTRRAGAIDVASRTEKVEVQIPNQDGKLLAGMYLTLKFKIAAPAAIVVVPANALDIRREGPRVALLVKKDGKDTVAYRPVTIGRDLGTSVELTGGLLGGEPLVLNPTSELTEGMEVVVAQPPAPAKK